VGGFASKFKKRLDITRSKGKVARCLHLSLQPLLRCLKPIQHPENLPSTQSGIDPKNNAGRMS
jgi:hypothetical protein